MPVLTVTVSDELFEQLQKLASDMERTAEECHVWALEDFVAQERVNLDADREAVAGISAGRFVTQEQMENWVESLDSPHPLPVPMPIQRAS